MQSRTFGPLKLVVEQSEATAMNTAAASVIIFSRSICSPRCRIFQELRSGLHRVLVSLKSDFWPDKRYSCQINLQAPSSSAHLKAECPGAWIPSREVPETKLLPHLPPSACPAVCARLCLLSVKGKHL